MSHFHKDCVECLQAEVERLHAALNEKENVDVEALNREAVKNKIEDLEDRLAKTIIERDTAIVELDRLRRGVGQRRCDGCGYSEEKHSGVSKHCPVYIEQVFKA